MSQVFTDFNLFIRIAPSIVVASILIIGNINLIPFREIDYSSGSGSGSGDPNNEKKLSIGNRIIEFLVFTTSIVFTILNQLNHNNFLYINSFIFTQTWFIITNFNSINASKPYFWVDNDIFGWTSTWFLNGIYCFFLYQTTFKNQDLDAPKDFFVPNLFGFSFYAVIFKLLTNIIFRNKIFELIAFGFLRDFTLLTPTLLFQYFIKLTKGSKKNYFTDMLNTSNQILLIGQSIIFITRNFPIAIFKIWYSNFNPTIDLILGIIFYVLSGVIYYFTFLFVNKKLPATFGGVTNILTLIIQSLILSQKILIGNL